MIDELKNLKQSGGYEKFIDCIRFPKFKNLIKDSKITFDYPITVFVGTNGSGKSSVLKALYGCISDKQISDFWFSTSIDPITEGGGESNCFIYNYTINGHTDEFEVLQIRRRRDNNPDYWETERPLVKYNMKRKTNDDNFRKPKITLDLEYLDFHSLLSAFDKYRYFLKGERILQANNFLRYKTNFLRSAIDNNKISGGSSPQNHLPIHLSPYELLEISKILNKTYEAGTIIYHKFFKLWGHSLLLKTNTGNRYSEAFAGSGENTVVTLVHRIINAQQNSIVLLDEPESCLHPGAQKRLFNFLCDQSFKKKLQIVISTHSKEFVNKLPKNAIKVFNELPNGDIQIINESNAESAFFHLGSDLDQKLVFVEDKLGKEILDIVSKELPPDQRQQIRIEIHPGGEKEIKKSIARYSKFNELKKFIMFDGDVRFNNGQEISFINPHTISVADNNTAFLENQVKVQTQNSKTDYFMFNSNEVDEIKRQTYFKYLEFWNDHCLFFPNNTPEELIWDDIILDNIGIIENNDKTKINSESDYKKKFRLTTLSLKGDDSSNSIFDTQKMFINIWAKQKNIDFSQILDNLRTIING